MRRLIVLRPEPGANDTVERAHALGLPAVAMPLFEVVPVEWRAPDPGSFDGLLLTSANALRHAGDAVEILRGLPVYAVGEATAQAAREAGFNIRSTGDNGIERLLTSVDQGMKLLHLCGEHRLAVDARQEIVAVPVYRSAELPTPDGLGDLEGAVAALHSPRAAARFATVVDQSGLQRSDLRLAAISGAALQAAGDGWGAAEAADRPTDAALLAVAARLCEKPAQQ